MNTLKIILIAVLIIWRSASYYQLSKSDKKISRKIADVLLFGLLLDIMSMTGFVIGIVAFAFTLSTNPEAISFYQPIGDHISFDFFLTGGVIAFWPGLLMLILLNTPRMILTVEVWILDTIFPEKKTPAEIASELSEFRIPTRYG